MNEDNTLAESFSVRCMFCLKAISVDFVFLIFHPNITEIATITLKNKQI